MSVDWSSEHWGQVGHNVHEAAWAPDAKHCDENDEETP